jgi:ribosomal protein S18 acetylase RimI-like enzyme
LQLNLSVVKSNEPARHLYESQGFQIYGVEQNAIHVDGMFLDEALMHLSLQ